ncbi:MAG: T9SS type A sorting domain-containing protein [Saprospiraceae bacterium]
MKLYSLLKSALLSLVLLAMAPSLSAQSCATTPFTFNLVQTPSGPVEVYMTASQSFPFAIFAQATQVGLKFPDGNQWGGSASGAISLNGSQGSGSWVESDFFDSPSCSSANDYLIIKLGTDWSGPSASFASGESKLIFTFEVPPPVSGPFCSGLITLLDPTDVLVTSFGCTGSFNIAPNVEMFPLGICNGFGGNTGAGVDCDINSPLPVELTTFTATKQGGDALLAWETASELNNAGFTVQRSGDGATWENLGWVEGNGTTQQATSYEYVDAAPQNGNNYYRLEQIDFDGQTELSEIRNVVFGSGPESLQAFPNPTSGFFTLDMPGYSNGDVQIRVTDATGRVVYEQHSVDFSNTRQEFDFTNLAPGLYQLNVRYPLGEDTLPLMIIRG